MRNLYLFVCLFVCLFEVNAQECGFLTPENYETYDYLNSERISNESSTVPVSYCINVCFRIVRDDNGTNAAVNPNIIPQALAQLNAAFNPHGIKFNQVGTYDYVNNTNYNSYTSTPSTSPALIPNCLNVFFINDFQGNPSRNGIGSFGTNRSVIRGSKALSNNNIAHEVGHNLNLVHTFSCTTHEILSCTENPLNTDVNTNGCINRGDKICDTPADYNPFDYTTSNPPAYPINSYNPKKNNIMSYWLNKTQFTAGQGERMKNAIFGAYQLQSIRSNQCFEIGGVSTIRYGQTKNYNVIGASFATPPTYSWSVSGNLKIVGSNTNPTVNIKINNPFLFSVNSTVSVTINGTITKTKTVSARGLFFWNPIGIFNWFARDYGNSGLIVPINPEDTEDPIVTYNWEIIENPNTTNTTASGSRPYFVGATTNESNKFTSSTNQAIVNWGSASNSYLITCMGITASGEEFVISENYVDVGDPKNNPCFKDAFQSVIAPNPVINNQVNVFVIKPENTTPCDYKNPEEQNYFNSDLDNVNNSITIFDYYGNQIYSNIFETNEFTIENLNLVSGNNYVVNLFTNEGGFRQQIIIAE